MKTLKILSLLGWAITIAGCNGTAGSIAGVYVMSFKNEYSVAADTIIIQVYNSSAGIYQVERRDGYHRIREGKILPKEFRQERWLATFEKDKQLLQENAYGRLIYVKEDGRSLSYGGTYQKIN